MEVIDTSIFIDHLRGYQPAVDFFDSINDATTLFSALTEAELLTGKSCNDTGKRESLLRFLHRWKKIDVTNAVAVKAGDLRRIYDITITDAIIAATALCYNAFLLTRDLGDFKGIPGLRVKSPY